jgi:predicted dinucleotide-binding enzyme
MHSIRRLAVLGAGHVGPVIARLALRAGYPVTIATSGDPEDIALITELIIPGAEPRWASDAVADADTVVLAMPLHRFLEVDPGLLAGYHDLEDRARPAGAPDRRAAGVAGDDPAAVAAVADLTGRLGYDPVRLDCLRAGRVLQPGAPVFGQVLTVP